jgi:hypothetical protein
MFCLLHRSLPTVNKWTWTLDQIRKTYSILEFMTINKFIKLKKQSYISVRRNQPPLQRHYLHHGTNGSSNILTLTSVPLSLLLLPCSGSSVCWWHWCKTVTSHYIQRKSGFNAQGVSEFHCLFLCYPVAPTTVFGREVQGLHPCNTTHRQILVGGGSLGSDVFYSYPIKTVTS